MANALVGASGDGGVGSVVVVQLFLVVPHCS